MEITRRHCLASFAGALSASAATLQQVRLGITTDEIDEDVATAAGFLHKHGLGYAEVRSIWGKYNTSHTLDKVREAKAIFDQHKIKTSVLSTAFFKIPLPSDTPQGRGILDSQWALLDSGMERAKIMGADKLRVFGFTYDGDKPDAAAYPRIYELLTEAARRAKRRGFRLALENVGQSYIWSGAQAAALLKAVREDNLGLTWDPNNAATSGEMSFPDGYRLLDPQRIIHVHLRDFKKNEAGKLDWCAVGEGEMDNLGQIRTLLKAGYKETFTLETHYKSPQGKAHASATSLAALLKVIEKV
ncbi:MAG: sugar phosphate isomerase/epimerase [Acidobacteriia bacterium]|nr:sugar phosphate isomerase/epimerase [Terriglobia bacterium]